MYYRLIMLWNFRPKIKDKAVLKGLHTLVSRSELWSVVSREETGKGGFDDDNSESFHVSFFSQT